MDIVLGSWMPKHCCKQTRDGNIWRSGSDVGKGTIFN